MNTPSNTAAARVLVVEDSDDQSALLRVYLEKAGCAVVTASSGEDAVREYTTAPPELAVVDLRLPGMDGTALIEQLREDVPGCAIVVTSVLEPWRYPVVDAALPKPFTRAQVLQVLDDLLPGRKRP
jgi:CheY-like chemotaxis protein